MYGYTFEECDFEVTYQEAVEEVENHQADIEAFELDCWAVHSSDGMIDAHEVLIWLGY